MAICIYLWLDRAQAVRGREMSRSTPTLVGARDGVCSWTWEQRGAPWRREWSKQASTVDGGVKKRYRKKIRVDASEHFRLVDSATCQIVKKVLCEGEVGSWTPPDSKLFNEGARYYDSMNSMKIRIGFYYDCADTLALQFNSSNY